MQKRDCLPTDVQLDVRSGTEAPSAAVLERLKSQPPDPAHPSSGGGTAVSLSEGAQTADVAKLAQLGQRGADGAEGSGAAEAVTLDERASANGGATGLQDESELVDGQRPLGELRANYAIKG